jgi:hypothetical protein
VPRVCSISSEDTVTFEFREWPDLEQPGAIDISHKGPCAVYMKKVTDPTTDPGHGSGWFKIWEQGYDSSSGKWCTEELIENNGRLSVSMPSDLLGGYYMLRPELLALHEADKSPPDPQFFAGCAQIFLDSSGSTTPATVSIPGYVSAGDAAVTFNIYNEPMALPYPMPGPPVYSAQSSTQSGSEVGQSVQTIGLEPEDWIVYNANWYGKTVASYSTEDGCWDASSDCWNQTTACYDSAPPTGNVGCVLIENMCTALQANCNNGDFKGPPSEFSISTPTFAPVSVPSPGSTVLAAGSVQSGVSSASKRSNLPLNSWRSRRSVVRARRRG